MFDKIVKLPGSNPGEYEKGMGFGDIPEKGGKIFQCGKPQVCRDNCKQAAGGVKELICHLYHTFKPVEDNVFSGL